MKRSSLGMVLALAAVVLAACGGVGQGAASCPQAGPDTALFQNEAQGYCLLYPAGYAVEEFADGSAQITSAPRELAPPQPFVSIRVTPAGGRSATQVADELEAEFAGMELAIERSVIAVGGEDAVVLDGLPGQDINRQVVVVHADKLYHLTFVPASEDYGDLYPQMGALYRTVIDSLAFTP